jgi:hypothetical protein
MDVFFAMRKLIADIEQFKRKSRKKDRKKKKRPREEIDTG